MLAPLREGALEGHPWRAWADASRAGGRMPGGQSRWSAGKDLSWEPLRIERVCEVKYDHLQGDRFRHAAVFLRWRPDRQPADCRYDQLEVTAPYELEKVFGAAGHRGLIAFPSFGWRRDRAAPAAAAVARDVLQVDPDARPGAEAAAHRIDQHVGRLQMRRGVRMPRPPALETGQRVFLLLRAPDLDRAGCSVSGGATAARAAVRPPASYSAAATARRPGPPFVTRRELQQRVERAGVLVDVAA